RSRGEGRQKAIRTAVHRRAPDLVLRHIRTRRLSPGEVDLFLAGGFCAQASRRGWRAGRSPFDHGKRVADYARGIEELQVQAVGGEVKHDRAKEVQRDVHCGMIERTTGGLPG